MSDGLLDLVAAWAGIATVCWGLEWYGRRQDERRELEELRRIVRKPRRPAVISADLR